MAEYSHEPCVSRGDCYHARGGYITGHKNIETGHLSRIRTPETCAKGGRIGARRHNELYGPPGTPEGRAKGGRIGGPIGGRRRIELHGPSWTSEGRIKAGRKNIESGHLENLRASGKCAQGGHITGPINIRALQDPDRIGNLYVWGNGMLWKVGFTVDHRTRWGIRHRFPDGHQALFVRGIKQADEWALHDWLRARFPSSKNEVYEIAKENIINVIKSWLRSRCK